MFVLVEESAEAIVSADVELRDRVGVGDRGRQWLQRAAVVDAAVRAMIIVVPFVLAQRVQQVSLVPDQRAVQQLAAADTP